jgi:hypothetical protein
MTKPPRQIPLRDRSSCVSARLPPSVVAADSVAMREQRQPLSAEAECRRCSGQIKVENDRFELQALDAVRVAPGSARELAAGAEGMEVLAFGLHSPGDGEMVTDWSAP